MTTYYNPTKATMMKRTRYPRIRISWWIIALLISIAMGVVMGALLATAPGIRADASSASAAPTAYYWSIPTRACRTEDSINCYWDAGRRGNGKGASFWVGRNGKIHYLNPHFRSGR